MSGGDGRSAHFIPFKALAGSWSGSTGATHTASAPIVHNRRPRLHGLLKKLESLLVGKPRSVPAKRLFPGRYWQEWVRQVNPG